MNKVNAITVAHEAAAHRSYLYRFALKNVRDSHLADDLVQQTLLAALQCSDTYQGGSSYRTWLTGILKHKMMDAFRERQRYVSIDNDGNGDNRPDGEPATRSMAGLADSLLPSAERLTELRHLLGSIDCALRTLPDGIADVFYASEVEGESAKDISGRMGISSDNVYVRVHRARKAIRTYLHTAGFAYAGADTAWSIA